MCGIAGIISLKKGQSLDGACKGKLEHMLTRIRERGPDGLGKGTEDDYTIGNVRLKIVGHDQGRQPIKEDGYCFVFNGEIYNYEELLKGIGISNVYSDTLAAYQLLRASSIDILAAFNGMFSFCYVTPEEIYLARDRFGKKPLFYTIHDDMLYFASEMKAFLDIIDFNIVLSENYMSLETEIAEKTIFDNIFQLEAGCYLKIDRKTKRIMKKRYYTSAPQVKDGRSEKQLIEELRFLVTDAIKLRVDTDKEFAVYASGGIDSSIIALVSQPKYIFSFLPNSKLVSSEDRYVDALASEMKQTQLIKVSSNQDDFLEHFIDMVYINEGPSTTLGAFAQYFLAREAKNHSVKITLSGIGADEFFNGYIRHAIATVPHSRFNAALFNAYEALIKKSEAVGGAIPPEIVYGNLLNRNNTENKMLRLELKKFFIQHTSPLTAISVADSHFTLPALLHTDDYLNMAFGIESRSPFMDYRLVEFALALPEKYKIHINTKTNEIYTKYLLREAFKDILPKKIYNRKDKIGLTSNIAELLREKMRYVFIASQKLLQTTFPNHSYFSARNDSLGQYSRWEYQICQLAITYLLFTRRYSKKEVYEYFISQAKN